MLSWLGWLISEQYQDTRWACMFSRVQSSYLRGNQDDRLALSPLLTLNDIKHLGVLLLEGAVEELIVKTWSKRKN